MLPAGWQWLQGVSCDGRAVYLARQDHTDRYHIWHRYGEGDWTRGRRCADEKSGREAIEQISTGMRRGNLDPKIYEAEPDPYLSNPLYASF